MFGKVFCTYLLLILFEMSVVFYTWLSEMNIKTLDVWREITLGIYCLLYSATLFHFCNYGHYFVNIVRYQNTLFEHMYGAFLLRYCLECK